jgi:hypothetical protein
MRLRHRLTLHRDNKTEQSCAEHVGRHVFHFYSVAGIVVHLKIFFDTTIYVLPFPVS